jgi:hypothetical protein
MLQKKIEDDTFFKNTVVLNAKIKFLEKKLHETENSLKATNQKFQSIQKDITKEILNLTQDQQEKENDTEKNKRIKFNLLKAISKIFVSISGNTKEIEGFVNIMQKIIIGDAIPQDTK